MKKAAVVAFVAVFLAGMVHFYYAEDHCPVHCPSRGGRMGHVHPHHACGTVCLCFWASLFGPETDDGPGPSGFLAVVARPADGRILATPAADIAHPPKFPAA